MRKQAVEAAILAERAAEAAREAHPVEATQGVVRQGTLSWLPLRHGRQPPAPMPETASAPAPEPEAASAPAPEPKAASAPAPVSYAQKAALPASAPPAPSRAPGRAEELLAETMRRPSLVGPAPPGGAQAPPRAPKPYENPYLDPVGKMVSVQQFMRALLTGEIPMPGCLRSSHFGELQAVVGSSEVGNYVIVVPKGHSPKFPDGTFRAVCYPRLGENGAESVQTTAVFRRAVCHVLLGLAPPELLGIEAGYSAGLCAYRVAFYLGRQDLKRYAEILCALLAITGAQEMGLQWLGNIDFKTLLPAADGHGIASRQYIMRAGRRGEYRELYAGWRKKTARIFRALDHQDEISFQFARLQDESRADPGSAYFVLDPPLLQTSMTARPKYYRARQRVDGRVPGDENVLGLAMDVAEEVGRAERKARESGASVTQGLSPAETNGVGVKLDVYMTRLDEGGQARETEWRREAAARYAPPHPRKEEFAARTIGRALARWRWKRLDAQLKALQRFLGLPGPSGGAAGAASGSTAIETPPLDPHNIMAAAQTLYRTIFGEDHPGLRPLGALEDPGAPPAPPAADERQVRDGLDSHKAFGYSKVPKAGRDLVAVVKALTALVMGLLGRTIERKESPYPPLEGPTRAFLGELEEIVSRAAAARKNRQATRWDTLLTKLKGLATYEVRARTAVWLTALLLATPGKARPKHRATAETLLAELKKLEARRPEPPAPAATPEAEAAAEAVARRLSVLDEALDQDTAAPLALRLEAAREQLRQAGGDFGLPAASMATELFLVGDEAFAALLERRPWRPASALPATQRLVNDALSALEESARSGALEAKLRDQLRSNLLEVRVRALVLLLSTPRQSRKEAHQLTIAAARFLAEVVAEKQFRSFDDKSLPAAPLGEAALAALTSALEAHLRANPFSGLRVLERYRAIMIERNPFEAVLPEPPVAPREGQVNLVTAVVKALRSGKDFFGCQDSPPGSGKTASTVAIVLAALLLGKTPVVVAPTGTVGLVGLAQVLNTYGYRLQVVTLNSNGGERCLVASENAAPPQYRRNGRESKKAHMGSGIAYVATPESAPELVRTLGDRGLRPENVFMVIDEASYGADVKGGLDAVARLIAFLIQLQKIRLICLSATFPAPERLPAVVAALPPGTLVFKAESGGDAVQLGCEFRRLTTGEPVRLYGWVQNRAQLAVYRARLEKNPLLARELDGATILGMILRASLVLEGEARATILGMLRALDRPGQLSPTGIRDLAFGVLDALAALGSDEAVRAACDSCFLFHWAPTPEEAAALRDQVEALPALAALYTPRQLEGMAEAAGLPLPAEDPAEEDPHESRVRRFLSQLAVAGPEAVAAAQAASRPPQRWSRAIKVAEEDLARAELDGTPPRFRHQPEYWTQGSHEGPVLVASRDPMADALRAAEEIARRYRAETGGDLWEHAERCYRASEAAAAANKAALEKAEEAGQRSAEEHLQAEKIRAAVRFPPEYQLGTKRAVLAEAPPGNDANARRLAAVGIAVLDASCDQEVLLWTVGRLGQCGLIFSGHIGFFGVNIPGLETAVIPDETVAPLDEAAGAGAGGPGPEAPRGRRSLSLATIAQILGRLGRRYLSKAGRAYLGDEVIAMLLEAAGCGEVFDLEAAALNRAVSQQLAAPFTGTELELFHMVATTYLEDRTRVDNPLTSGSWTREYTPSGIAHMDLKRIREMIPGLAEEKKRLAGIINRRRARDKATPEKKQFDDIVGRLETAQAREDALLRQRVEILKERFPAAATARLQKLCRDEWEARREDARASVAHLHGVLEEELARAREVEEKARESQKDAELLALGREAILPEGETEDCWEDAFGAEPAAAPAPARPPTPAAAPEPAAAEPEPAAPEPAAPEPASPPRPSILNCRLLGLTPEDERRIRAISAQAAAGELPEAAALELVALVEKTQRHILQTAWGEAPAAGEHAEEFAMSLAVDLVQLLCTDGPMVRGSLGLESTWQMLVGLHLAGRPACEHGCASFANLQPRDASFLCSGCCRAVAASRPAACRTCGRACAVTKTGIRLYGCGCGASPSPAIASRLSGTGRVGAPASPAPRPAHAPVGGAGAPAQASAGRVGGAPAPRAPAPAPAPRAAPAPAPRAAAPQAPAPRAAAAPAPRTAAAPRHRGRK